MPSLLRATGLRAGGLPRLAARSLSATLPGMAKVVSIHAVEAGAAVSLPLAFSCVRAGFPSPAEDHAERSIDLVATLVKNQAATFLMKVSGDSMEAAGIQDGALLVVDRSLEAQDGSIVIAAVAGELTVKRLRRSGGRCWLEAANPRYQPIPVTSEDDTVVGVVLHAISSFRP